MSLTLRRGITSHFFPTVVGLAFSWSVPAYIKSHAVACVSGHRPAISQEARHDGCLQRKAQPDYMPQVYEVLGLNVQLFLRGATTSPCRKTPKRPASVP